MITLKDIDVTSLNGGLDAIPTSGLEFSTATGMLYASKLDPITEEALFLSLDPKSGVLSQLGAIPGIGVQHDSSAMAGTDYYSIMSDVSMTKKLVHVSVAGSGFNVTVKDIDTSDLGGTSYVVPSSGLEFAQATGLLYAYEWDHVAGEQSFLSIDPASGKLSRLGTIPGISFVHNNGAMSGTDYYSIMSDASMVKKLVHISVADGGFSATMTDIDTSDLSGHEHAIPALVLRHSQVTGMLYAHEWDWAEREELFMLIDPVSGRLRRLDVFPGLSHAHDNGAIGGAQEVPNGVWRGVFLMGSARGWEGGRGRGYAGVGGASQPPKPKHLALLWLYGRDRLLLDHDRLGDGKAARHRPAGSPIATTIASIAPTYTPAIPIPTTLNSAAPTTIPAVSTTSISTTTFAAAS